MSDEGVWQVRKLAASRDIACSTCDGKGGTNVKQCQVKSSRIMMTEFSQIDFVRRAQTISGLRST
jgi:Tfp pilus tip-associated adhesin PilY1